MTVGEARRPGAVEQCGPSGLDNVHVAVRVRPLLVRERMGHASEGVSVTEGKVVAGERVFFFDSVLDQHASQEQVFRSTVAPIVESALAGYSGTVFAYGATASGKTYTMGMHADFGASEKGVLSRVLERLVAEEKQSAIFTVNFSLLEIYNEDIRDLLRLNAPPLQIREDALGNIHIPNASTHRLSRNMAEAFLAIQRGLETRVTGTTLLNDRSSRSHCVLTFTIDRILANGVSVRAKLNLVDLAGSERQKRTGASGARLKESASINSGLLALGNVISALTNPDVSPANFHVPYRDSKLTRLLQDALGGSSRCAMIACVSPAAADVEETANTLRYAARAKHIKNHPTITTVESGPAAPALAAFRSIYQRLVGSMRRGDSEAFEAVVEDFRVLVGEADGGKLGSPVTSSLDASFSSAEGGGEAVAELDEALDKQESLLEALQTKDEEWLGVHAEFSGRLRDLEQELERTKLEVQELETLLVRQESMLEHERLLLTRKYEEAMKRMTRQVKEIETREKELKLRLKERESAKKRIAVLEENVRTLRLDRDQLKAALTRKPPPAARLGSAATSAPATGRGGGQQQQQPVAARVFFGRYQEERERLLQRRAAAEQRGETEQKEMEKLRTQMQNVVKFMTTHCGVEQVFVDALLVSSQNQFP